MSRTASASHLRARASDAILRILGGARPEAQAATEIAPLLAERGSAEVFAPEERAILERALGLGERPVGSLMTEASEVVWLDIEADAETLQRRILETGHVAYPVYRGSRDNLLGVARASDLVCSLLENGRIRPAIIERRPPRVREATSALRVIEQLRRARVPMAVVTDDAGAIRGVATPTDVLKALIGGRAAATAEG